MKGRERLREALASAGAVLKRQKKHLVYGLPNGKQLTVSATPGDHRAEDKALTDLRAALGGEPRTAIVNPPRSKAKKPGRLEPDALLSSERRPALSALAEALKKSGVHQDAELAIARETEKSLRWRLETAEAQYGAALDRVKVLESLFVVRAYEAIFGRRA